MGHSILWFFLSAVVVCVAQNGPTVITQQGPVVGVNVNGQYNAFYAIPFAGSVSGENRFKAPTAPLNFLETFDATDPLAYRPCIQPTNFGVVGEEDCLTLNIFAKNAASPMPVFVLVEGEDYTTTKNNIRYNFGKLVEADVVVVTLNYRLSVFGFLCLGVEEAPGNAGLKDIIAGLRWINQNIARFGGNPNNVLLFGHGSGAAMADLITLSPLSQGLVHKVIAMSGTSLAPWAVSYNPDRSAEDYAEVLGISSGGNTNLARALAQTNAFDLVNALKRFKFLNNTALFAPCIENTNIATEAVLTDAPINIIRSGSYNHVPFIAGFADADGSIRAKEALYGGWLKDMDLNFANALQADLGFDSDEDRATVAQAVRNFYFGAGAIDSESMEEYLRYQRDTLFAISTFRAAHERSWTTWATVRVLDFGFNGIEYVDGIFPGLLNVTGAKHGSILNYIFDYNLNEFERWYVQRNLIRRFVAFAYTGIPQDGNIGMWWDPAYDSYPVPLWMGYFQIRGGQMYSTTTFSEGFMRLFTDYGSWWTFWDNIYSNHYLAPKSVW